MTKKCRKIVFLFILSAFLFVACSVSFAFDVKKELKRRSTILFVEGMQIENIVVGARAKFEILYMDRGIANKLAENKDKLSYEVDWALRFVYDPKYKDKEIFLVVLKTFQPFTFDVNKFCFNGYCLTKEDVITEAGIKIPADIPSKVRIFFVVVVPKKYISLKQGVVIKYDNYKTKLKL